MILPISVYGSFKNVRIGFSEAEIFRFFFKAFFCKKEVNSMAYGHKIHETQNCSNDPIATKASSV